MRQGSGVWEGRVSETNLIPKSRVPREAKRVRQGPWEGSPVLTSSPLYSASLVVADAHTAARVTDSPCAPGKRPLGKQSSIRNRV